MKRTRIDRPSGFELTGTLESFLSEYLYTGSPKTEANYRNHLRPFADYCVRTGLATLDVVTPDCVRLFLKEQSRYQYFRRGDTEPRQLARSTFIQRYAALKTFFNWCVEEGRLEVSPMAHVKRPKEEQRLRPVVSQDDFALLLRNAAQGAGWLGLRDRAILLFLVDTGARAGELMAMTERCVDWRAGTVVLHGKGSKDRTMRMSAETRRALRTYVEHKARPRLIGDPVWVTLRRHPLNASALAAIIHAIEEYAGLEYRLTPHMFRHTFAAEFTRLNNGNIKAAKERLGHSKIATTERYITSLGGGYGLGEEFRTPGEQWGKA